MSRALAIVAPRHTLVLDDGRHLPPGREVELPEEEAEGLLARGIVVRAEAAGAAPAEPRPGPWVTAPAARGAAVTRA